MTPNDKRPGQFDELLDADEGPMRRELMRQIAALELRFSQLRRDHAPYEQLPPALERGPAVLSTEALEQVRDELLETINQLEQRVADRFVAGITDQADPLDQMWAADPDAPWLRRVLLRLRRALRDPRAR
ncbi:MAG: hypothetical protein ACYDHH_17050 [Solirubrobacteraceae bacterium]